MARSMLTAEVDISYYLVLNPMTGRVQEQSPTGPFSSKEEAITFYNNEKVEPYDDEGPDCFNGGTKNYRKAFRKGGPLEWCNPLSDDELQAPGIHGHGIHEKITLINIIRVDRI